MKKKILSISLAILILAQALFLIVPVSAADDAWTGTEATAFAGGSGTADDPYQIATGAQLAYLAAQVNGGTNYSGKYFRLTDHIDLENREWLVIGNAHNKPFQGVFDGNGKTISGLRIADEKPYNAALFGKVMGSTAVIKNLTVSGKITGKIKTGAAVPAIATVCGSLYSGASMENVTAYADITTTESTVGCYVAGLIGYVTADAKVTGCKTYGSITTTNEATKNQELYVGGMLGRVQGCTLTDCVNYADVSNIRASGTTPAGGLIGVSMVDGGVTTRLVRCINYGNVYAEAADGAGNYRVGGMIGNTDRGNNGKSTVIMDSCVNLGKMSGKGVTGAGGAGGMIGYDESKSTTLTNCITVGTNLSYPVARIGKATVLNNCVAGLSVDTLDGARVRIAQPTGIRFDSTLSKAAYDSLKSMGADVTLGTLIAPTQRVTEAGAFTKEALDALSTKLSGTPTYQTVTFTPGTSSWVETGNEALYGFSGALANIQSENYNLAFSAVGYITVTLGELSFTLYADYSGEENRSRSIAYTATLAYNDRTAAADATHTVYVEADGNYSPYGADALAIIKGFADQYAAG